MKFEIAKELGLADKVVAGGWRSLTAKESGRIGGLMTKRKESCLRGKNTSDEEENFRTENSYPQKVTGKLPLNNRQFSFIMRKKEFG